MKAKTKFTKLWSILLALAMVVGMLPIAALAAGSATATADFVSDPTTALALLNDAKTGTTESTWDADSKTLTLNGVNFVTTAATAVKLPDGTTIVLNGENTITSTYSGSEDSYGIYAYDGSLTIQDGSEEGTGTLNVTGGTANGGDGYSYGICADSKVEISGGTVTATGGAANGEDGYSHGIYAYENVEISGGTVTATGGAAGYDSRGICAYKNVEISGGTVTATGGTANNEDGESYGIYAYKNVEISDGTVTATGGTANGGDGYSYGIYGYENVGISGGTVTATGGTTEGTYGVSYGIFAAIGSLNISGGKVEATGGTADSYSGNSYGIRANDSVSISGGEVEANGGKADSYSNGIYADKDVSITGGTVTATGGATKNGKSNGIFADDGNVTITGGSVKATGGTANSLSVGISADNDAVTISGDNTVVTATGGTATKDSYGIYSNGDTKISGGTTRVTATGGTVNATGGTAGSGYDSCGICADDNVIIEDGIVSAKGGKATDDSYGICAYKNVTIKSGTVNATGGAAQMTEGSMSGGIQGSYSITIEDGIVEATGGAAWISCGFSIVSLGNMYISDGTVIATGGTSTEKGSYGIYTDYSAYVTITGGSLIAKAGSAPSAKALPWAPDTLPDTYWWRSSDSGQYKKGDFNWGDVSTYVEIGDTEPITTYSVTFDANGGTGTMADVTDVLGDYTLPANGFTAPAGKQFKCWSVGGTEKAVGDKITVSANTTVKAVWEDITYTVSFDANDGSGTMADVTGISGEYTLPENGFTAPEGKQFKSWSVDGKEKAVGDKITVTADTTVKAVWENIPVTTYTVSFDANGGKGTMADVTRISGEYTLPANGFTAPEGKQFKCWSVDGKEKAVGDKITVTADTTVKAVWENIPTAPTEYNILDGANSKWTQDSDGNLSVRASGEFSKFVGVKVDGKSVDEKYYTVKEGSTIVTLKAGYLNTLTVGSHTLEIIWTDGSASTAFTVRAQTVVESPQTGDNSMMALWIAVLFISGFGVVATAVYGKKRKPVK